MEEEKKPGERREEKRTLTPEQEFLARSLLGEAKRREAKDQEKARRDRDLLRGIAGDLGEEDPRDPE